VFEPDPQVVAAAGDGDVGAFSFLVRRYQGDVWRLSFQLVRDEALADDVTQESFLRAYRFLPRYRGDSKFSTWLFSIVRNCALDELRRAGRRRRLSDRLEGEPRPSGSEAGVRLEVAEALSELSLELRTPVVLIDMFGLSYGEVARMLGVPVGTIKSRVHRARHQLAEALHPSDRRRADG
jgi:RNA polymerase sigma-70 factor (ECF subfamily)